MALNRNLTIAVAIFMLLVEIVQAQPSETHPGSDFRKPRGSFRTSGENDLLAGTLASALNTNGDSELSADEIAAAPQSLLTLDQDHDGKIAAKELAPQGPPHRESRARFNPGRGHQDRSASFNPRPIQNGYVFINGVYLAPPYLIRDAGDGLFINDQRINLNLFEPGGHGRPGISNHHRAEDLARKLEAGDITVMFDGQPQVSFSNGSDLLAFYQILLAKPDWSTELDSLITPVVNSQSFLQHWRNWLSTYKAPDDLLDRLRIAADSIETLVADTEAQMAASKRIVKWSYPLTVGGMVLVVLAIGHILSFRPNSDTGALVSPQGAKATILTVLLMLGLSSMDLVWTVMAWQAGIMSELNPVGSQLLQNPSSLILFKLTASAIAGGLLVGLRHYRSAQLASWWLCLICTLVTCRWLVFNSMFVT